MDESILRRLFRRGDEPARLARSCGLSLVDLARWASRVDHVELLVGLERVSDACFRAALARSRVIAARTLTRLASGDGDEALTDLTRRSCVDLLSACAERRREARCAAASTGVDRARRAASVKDAASLAPPVPDEEAILAALERVAREGDADDDGRGSETSPPAVPEQSDAA